MVFSIGKDRQSKPFPDIVPVDYDDYDLVRKEEKEENDDLDQERV